MARNIERLIHQAEEQDQERQQERANPAEAGDRRGDFVIDKEFNRRAGINYTEDHPVVHDWSDCEILIGDTVQFLTRGRHDSWEGVVYRYPATEHISLPETTEAGPSQEPHAT